MTLLSYLIDAHWLVFVLYHYDLGKLQQGTVGDSHVPDQSWEMVDKLLHAPMEYNLNNSDAYYTCIYSLG